MSPGEGVEEFDVDARFESVVALPIPESNRIWGDPIEPAERMTSRFAWNANFGARKVRTLSSDILWNHEQSHNWEFAESQ